MNFLVDLIKDDIVNRNANIKTQTTEHFDTDEREMVRAEYFKHEVVRTDKGKFFKVFHKAEKEYMALSYPAMKLLNYISFRLLEGQYEVLLDPKDVLEVCQWKSKAIFYRALKELTEKKFMFKHEAKGMHYINPAFFFNGRREKLVRYDFNKPFVVNGQKVRRIGFFEVMEPVKEGENNDIR